MIGKTISGVTINNEFMAFQVLHSLYNELRYRDRIIYLNQLVMSLDEISLKLFNKFFDELDSKQQKEALDKWYASR